MIEPAREIEQEKKWTKQTEGDTGTKTRKMMHDKTKWSTGISSGFTRSALWREERVAKERSAAAD